MNKVVVGILVSTIGLATAGCVDDGIVAPNSPPAFRHVEGMATGRAKMHPANQSGVKGVISFTDDGSDLTIEGTASGMDPSKPYASLIYDRGSVPGGPDNCEPTIFDPTDPNFLLPTMLIGFWTVDADGNGTLSEVNIIDDATGVRVHVPLGRFKTVSIRDLTVNGGFGPTAVAACGEVAVHPAR